MILNFSGNGTINKYVGLIAAGFVTAKLFLQRRIQITTELLPSILFLIYCGIATLFPAVTPLTTYITLISLVLMYYMYSLRGINDREFSLLKYSMIISSVVLVFFLAPNLAVSYSRGTLTSSAGSADSNSLAANMLFGLLCSADEIVNGKKFVTKIVNSIFALLIVIGIFFTGSRGALLTGVLSIATYFLMYCARRGIRIKDVILTSLIVVVSFQLIKSNVSTTVLSRLSLSSIQMDSGSGRFEIWSYLLKESTRNPISLVFGHGYATALAAHNVFIEYLYSTGIVGLSILIYFIFSQFKRSYRKNDILAISLLVINVFTCLSIGFLLNKGFWNAMTVVFLHTQLLSNNMERENNAGISN